MFFYFLGENLLRGANMEKYKQWMQHALDISRRAIGFTAPNPMVGAVILDEQDNFLSEGWHEKVGEAHAEINALRNAGSLTKGGTMIVTLEPCSHFGKTPPCTQAIIKAGINKVIIATLDPNPLVAGQGVKQLQAAGISVEIGLLEKKAQRLNEVFFKWITKKQPFVAAKFAMTLDGKIATGTGDSKWISCPLSREYAHVLRTTYAAILVGGNTVRIDNPELTCRLVAGRNPVRIILTNSFNLPLDSKVFLADGVPTIIITTSGNENYEEFKKIPNIEVVELPSKDGKVILTELLDFLAQRDLTSVLVEGGSEIHAGFLQAGLVDKVYTIIAPKIIGGSTAKSPVGDLGIDYMSAALQLEDLTVEKLQQDVLITGYLKRGE